MDHLLLDTVVVQDAQVGGVDGLAGGAVNANRRRRGVGGVGQNLRKKDKGLSTVLSDGTEFLQRDGI